MKLTKAILGLKSTMEIENFLKDILTPNEINAIEERWSIAKLLYKKELTYREIATELGTSTATVTRVGRYLQGENNGYLTALKKIKTSNMNLFNEHGTIQTFDNVEDILEHWYHVRLQKYVDRYTSCSRR